MKTMDQPQDLYKTRLSRPGPVTERQHPTVWGGPHDGPIEEADLEGYDERGYMIVEEMLSDEEVAAYKRVVSKLAADRELRSDPRVITEKASGEVRSIFEVQDLSPELEALARDPRILGRAQQILGSEVYLHQTRVNYMPGFKGTGFYWHSDFETWHAEDGMPIPRAVSVSIALTRNYPFNGGLMVMPGSQRDFVPSIGETPDKNYASSLKEQTVGVPSEEAITELARRYGIDQFTGEAGSAIWFDSNTMHGSGNNITPFPRSNVFFVFNSVENALVEPFGAKERRPNHIANRDFTPLS